MLFLVKVLEQSGMPGIVGMRLWDRVLAGPLNRAESKAGPPLGLPPALGVQVQE